MSPMISRSFLITPTDADRLRVAAAREGCTAGEFIRRAVTARVDGTTATAGPSLNTTAQLQASAAALIAAQKLVEETNAQNADALKAQIDRLGKGIELLGDVATMLQPGAQS